MELLGDNNMDFLNILPEQDGLKLQLIEYLLTLVGSEVPVQTVKDNLQISDYKFEDTLFGLNTDIEFLTMMNGFEIRDNWLIFGHVVSRDLLQQLRNYYFEMAPLAALISEILAINKFPKPIKMEQNYGWSRSYFFKQKKILKTIIDKYIQEVDEATMRYFLFDIYNYFCSEIAFNNNVDQQLQQKVIAYFDDELKTPSQKQQMALLAAILVKRIQMAELNFTNGLLWMSPKETLTVYLMETFKISRERAILESQFLNQFLYTNGIIVNRLTKNEITNTWKSIYEQIMIITQKTLLPYFKQEIIKLDAFVIQVTPIILAELILKNKIKNLSFERTKYFKEIYPTLYHAAKKLIDELGVKLQITDPAQAQRLLFKIINQALSFGFDMKKLDRIEICIDFSGGAYVNQFMQTTMNSYINVNVEVSNILTKTTDIYLGDKYIPNLGVEEIIWVKPPTPVDWATLGKLIAKIKQQKFELGGLIDE